MTKRDSTRIYIVEGPGINPRLVDASHPRVAVRHVTGAMFSARVPKQRELATLISGGTKIEEASEAQPE